MRELSFTSSDINVKPEELHAEHGTDFGAVLSHRPQREGGVFGVTTAVTYLAGKPSLWLGSE